MDCQLLTREEESKTALCENCKLVVPALPKWPKGWTRSGRSRLRVVSDKKDASTFAWWCPNCDRTTLPSWKNPTEAECRKLREELMHENV